MKAKFGNKGNKMSELTTCNHCSFEAIKRQARLDKMKVLTKSSASSFGGVDVFIVPKTVTKREMLTWKDASDKLPNGCANHRKYWAAWFMELPDHCCC